MCIKGGAQHRLVKKLPHSFFSLAIIILFSQRSGYSNLPKGITGADHMDINGKIVARTLEPTQVHLNKPEYDEGQQSFS